MNGMRRLRAPLICEPPMTATEVRERRDGEMDDSQALNEAMSVALFGASPAKSNIHDEIACLLMATGSPIRPLPAPSAGMDAMAKMLDSIDEQVKKAMYGTFSLEAAAPRWAATRPMNVADFENIVQLLFAKYTCDYRHCVFVSVPMSEFNNLFDSGGRPLRQIGQTDRRDPTMKLHGIVVDFLASDEIRVVIGGGLYSICADREALASEIKRCLGWDEVRKLPQSPGGDRVRAISEAIGQIGTAPRPTSSHDRNADSGGNLTNEAKIVAAKAAIAAYARDKKLPSAEMLATFGELDRPRAERRLIDAEVRKGVKAAMLAVVNHVNGDCHSLASEALSRAADQSGVTDRGGAYRDFIGAAAQGFAKMIDAGDAAADGQGTHNHRG